MPRRAECPSNLNNAEKAVRGALYSRAHGEKY